MPAEVASFPGGLRLPGHKEQSTRLAIGLAPLAERFVLPLQQHIGMPSQPVVEEGDRVLKAQTIARAEGYVSVPLHAPTSGRVVSIGEYAVPHPSGLSGLCIVIEADGEDRSADMEPIADFVASEPEELRSRIRRAGIVGMGGAGFPTFVKLNPGPRRRVHTLILNAAECEPYITCDDMLLREHAGEVVSGMLMLSHVLRAETCLIGIEDNKPEASAALRAALADKGMQDAVELLQVPSLYPAGGEKQLIQMLTGREIPSGGLPADIGVVCHNAATAYAVHRAVAIGEPLVSRVVTVTGGALAEPRNLLVPLGTPVRHLLRHCGVDQERLERLVMGGPMMGMALHSQDAPVVKTTNCLLAGTAEDFAPTAPALPCIRCGRCAEVCPASLLPQQLYWYAQAKDFDRAQDYNLFDCIECGCCAYVCPSRLPLVDYYRFAKAEIWALEQERGKAELARRRFEFRQQRLDRDKEERAARLAAKKAQLGKPDDRDAKKAAIQAAVERVQARKRSEQDNVPVGDGDPRVD